VSEILQNIELFDFEDRKNLLAIIMELNSNVPELVENTLDPEKENIVKAMLNKYKHPGLATTVGSILRLFTKTNVSY